MQRFFHGGTTQWKLSFMYIKGDSGYGARRRREVAQSISNQPLVNFIQKLGRGERKKEGAFARFCSENQGINEATISDLHTKVLLI